MKHVTIVLKKQRSVVIDHDGKKTITKSKQYWVICSLCQKAKPTSTGVNHVTYNLKDARKARGFHWYREHAKFSIRKADDFKHQELSALSLLGRRTCEIGHGSSYKFSQAQMAWVELDLIERALIEVEQRLMFVTPNHKGRSREGWLGRWAQRINIELRRRFLTEDASRNTLGMEPSNDDLG